MRTRSQRQVVADDADNLRGMSGIEEVRSGDFTVESPLVLNPHVTPFPNPKSHEDPQLVVLSPHTELECTYQEHHVESLPEVAVIEPVDLPEPEMVLGVPDYPEVCPDDDDNHSMLGCKYAECSYGMQGDEGGLNSSVLIWCKICKDMLEIDTFICDS